MFATARSASFGRGLGETTDPFPAALLDAYAKQVDACLSNKPYDVDRGLFYKPTTTRCLCERTIVEGLLIECLYSGDMPWPSSFVTDVTAKLGKQQALLETLDKQISSLGPGTWFTNPDDRYKLASILSKIALYWRNMGPQGAKSTNEDLARRRATEHLRLYRDSNNQILLLITFSDILHSEERDAETLISAIKGIRDVLLKAGPQEIPFDAVTTALSRLRERASELERDEKVRATAVQVMAQIAQAGSAPVPASPAPASPAPLASSRTSGHLVAAAVALAGIGALFYFTRERGR